MKLKKLARLLCTTISSVACVATAAEKIVSQETMKAIYEEVKTPYKVGMVLLPEKDECLDDPAVFRHGDAWYMTVVRYVNKGYETHLAKSADLVHWQRLGCTLKRGEPGTWDSAQKGVWREMIGIAVSDDMLKWRRVGDGPLLDNGSPDKRGLTANAMLQKIDDVWVMFYFCYLWRPGGAFDTFACSYDLKNWTKWEGEPIQGPRRGRIGF